MTRYDPSGRQAVSITDAEPSFDDEQRVRRRQYTVLMVVHIAGFILGGLLYYQIWWLGLVLVIVTTPLPWVAVVIANGPRPHRGVQPQRLPRAALVPMTKSASPAGRAGTHSEQHNA